MGQVICFFGLTFCLLFGPLFSTPYQKPAHISQDVWDAMKPYFLPEKSSLRKKLDKIFSVGRPSADKISLLKAGFYDLKTGFISNTTVGWHHKLKNYVIKLFTDDIAVSEWEPLKKRVEAAQSVRQAIKILGYENYFVVPQKWIYPLPNLTTAASNAVLPKNFILIAEEIDILSTHDNLRAWGRNTNERLLVALHHLIAIEGLQDSVLPCNIPLTKKGKIALVDLEHHHEWPIPFHKMTEFLCTPIKLFWNEIID